MGLTVAFGSCRLFHIVSLSQWVDKQWMVIAYDSAKRDTRGIVADSNVEADISYVTILYARVVFCSVDTIDDNDSNHSSRVTKLFRFSFLTLLFHVRSSRERYREIISDPTESADERLDIVLNPFNGIHRTIQRFFPFFFISSPRAFRSYP